MCGHSAAGWVQRDVAWYAEGAQQALPGHTPLPAHELGGLQFHVDVTKSAFPGIMFAAVENNFWASACLMTLLLVGCIVIWHGILKSVGRAAHGELRRAHSSLVAAVTPVNALEGAHSVALCSFLFAG
jgi:hypothetical protein